jgi:hypothetical protein
MEPYRASAQGARVYTLAELEGMDFPALQDVYRTLPVRDEGPHAPSNGFGSMELAHSIVRLEADAYARGCYDGLPGVERYTREELYAMDRGELWRLYGQLGCQAGPDGPDPDLLPEYVLLGQRSAFQMRLLTEEHIER